MQRISSGFWGIVLLRVQNLSTQQSVMLSCNNFVGIAPTRYKHAKFDRGHKLNNIDTILSS